MTYAEERGMAAGLGAGAGQSTKTMEGIWMNEVCNLFKRSMTLFFVLTRTLAVSSNKSIMRNFDVDICSFFTDIEKIETSMKRAKGQYAAMRVSLQENQKRIETAIRNFPTASSSSSHSSQQQTTAHMSPHLASQLIDVVLSLAKVLPDVNTIFTGRLGHYKSLTEPRNNALATARKTWAGHLVKFKSDAEITNEEEREMCYKTLESAASNLEDIMQSCQDTKARVQLVADQIKHIATIQKDKWLKRIEEFCLLMFLLDTYCMGNQKYQQIYGVVHATLYTLQQKAFQIAKHFSLGEIKVSVIQRGSGLSTAYNNNTNNYNNNHNSDIQGRQVMLLMPLPGIHANTGLEGVGGIVGGNRMDDFDLVSEFRKECNVHATPNTFASSCTVSSKPTVKKFNLDFLDKASERVTSMSMGKLGANIQRGGHGHDDDDDGQEEEDDDEEEGEEGDRSEGIDGKKTLRYVWKKCAVLRQVARDCNQLMISNLQIMTNSIDEARKIIENESGLIENYEASLCMEWKQFVLNNVVKELISNFKSHRCNSTATRDPTNPQLSKCEPCRAGVSSTSASATATTTASMKIGAPQMVRRDAVVAGELIQHLLVFQEEVRLTMTRVKELEHGVDNVEKWVASQKARRTAQAEKYFDSVQETISKKVDELFTAFVSQIDTSDKVLIDFVQGRCRQNVADTSHLFSTQPLEIKFRQTVVDLFSNALNLRKVIVLEAHCEYHIQDMDSFKKSCLRLFKQLEKSIFQQHQSHHHLDTHIFPCLERFSVQYQNVQEDSTDEHDKDSGDSTGSESSNSNSSSSSSSSSAGTEEQNPPPPPPITTRGSVTGPATTTTSASTPSTLLPIPPPLPGTERKREVFVAQPSELALFQK
jgi:hypothetical protein